MNVSIHETIVMRRLWFDKHVALYENINFDITLLLSKINEEETFYSDVKRFVLRQYNVMMYPKLCSELYKTRDHIKKTRLHVLELLIENLTEKFEMYKSDTFDNI
jgi:hypothetical protein